MARISIGIPVYNEENYISDTLNSVISQLEDYTDIEIVISENGSTDNTLRNIEATLSQNDKYLSSIKLLKQSSNKGAFFNIWNTFDHCDSEFFFMGGRTRHNFKAIRG